MRKIIIILGEAGTGKSTMRRELLNKYKDIIELKQYTSRKPREYKLKNSEYIFINKDDIYISFKYKNLYFYKEINNKILELRKFKKDDEGEVIYFNLEYDKYTDEINLLNTSIQTINLIFNYYHRKNIFFVKLKTDENIRLERLSKRSSHSNEEIIRRMKSDKKDFDYYENKYQLKYDLILDTGKYNIDECINTFDIEFKKFLQKRR